MPRSRTSHWTRQPCTESTAWCSGRPEGLKGRQYYDGGATDGGKYDTRPTTSLPTIWLSRWRGHQLVPGREALEAWEASRSPIEPSHKPLITVWAEENRALDGGYEWSFGNGSNQHATLGYAMPTPGRIKTMTLCIVPKSVAARVGLVVNGRDVPNYEVSTSASQRAGIVSWVEAYELAPGDAITFKTIWSDVGAGASGAIVSVLIELDQE